MKLRFRWPYALALVLLFAQSSMAVPTLYPDFYSRLVRNQTNSNYMADTRDYGRFYVLPPGEAVVRPRSLHTVTANVGFCREISELQKFNLDTLRLINAMKTRESQTQVRVEQEKSRVQQLKNALSQYTAVRNLDEVIAIDVRIHQLEQRLDHLYDRYKVCVQDCLVLNRDIQESQRLRTELSAQRISIAAKNMELLVEYDRMRGQIKEIEESIVVMEADNRKIRIDLFDLYTQFNRMFDAHSAREGGRVSVLYESGWSQNVEKLRRDNPSFRFEKIPTKNAVIRAALLNRDRVSPSGAVIAFEVGGRSADGVLHLESYPEAFLGDVVLNLLGACPLLHPDWFGLKSPPSLQDMTFGLNVGFEYPAAMKYEVTAHYNMYRMYELIKSQGQSGGFFSTHSWSTQDEQLFFRDAFRVDWKVQDDKKVITEEQKQAVNADLRRQVMSRLAAHLVMSNPTSPLVMPTAPPKSGALVLANSLSGACPGNTVCQGASIVLNVLQSVFGGAEMSQHLRQTLNINLRDTYSSESVVMQPMLTTYR